MAAVSIGLTPGADQHQAAIATAVPGGSLAVQIRIADGTSHEEVRRALAVIEAYIRMNLTSGL